MTSSEGAVTRCRLRGELDCGSAAALVATVSHAVDGDVGLLALDLDELSFCDAAGVTALLCVQAHAARHRTKVAVHGARGIVRRVFEIVELGRAMRVV